ncbi:hypothetical protein JAAARDRAFT_584661 [Jaapia argillacea MUCL 33604]|uniref:Uncharacterized protein n=1 Tax=Jaapia argillacea MUCL 33604 TaxID=933084 RepID=A0A067PJ15_9AGAM|nr:hypothetical protein JAAARDRAFT_584661 [Jaapia argillacea MUCL 33604]
MFNLPTGPKLNSSGGVEKDVVGEEKGCLAVVPVAEEGKTLGRLLDLIHPGQAATFDTLQSLRTTLQAANKYGMEGIVDGGEPLLLASLESDSVGVYAVACAFKFEKTTRLAAKLTLRQPMLFPFSKELECISGAALYRLLEYRQACGKQAIQAANTAWDHNLGAWCRRQSCERASQTLGMYTVTLWWWDYIHETHDRLKECPSSDAILDPALASPFIERAMKCEICQGTLPSGFGLFTSRYAKEADAAVSQVHLQVEF